MDGFQFVFESFWNHFKYDFNDLLGNFRILADLCKCAPRSHGSMFFEVSAPRSKSEQHVTENQCEHLHQSKIGFERA